MLNSFKLFTSTKLFNKNSKVELLTYSKMFRKAFTMKAHT